MYTLMVILGGMATTSGLTGNSLMCLMQRPELRQALLDDPGLLESETEEFAFGVGIHRCLGSHLARVMFQEMMSEILSRLPDFELNGEPVRFDDAGEVYALRQLPLKFTPGPRVSSS